MVFVCAALTGFLHASAPSQNASLQRAVRDAMRGHAGTAVVMDVETGRVLASHKLDVAARTLARPGSAIKPFTLWTLLERGVIDSSTSYLCRREVRIGGHKLDCTHPPLSVALDPTTALAYSCNDYFTHFALRLGDADLKQRFSQWGLGSATGLASREPTGVIRTPGTAQERQLQAIGESDIEVTPLALLSAYRKLALRRRAVDPGAAILNPVFKGLEQCVQYGTGQMASVPGLEVAGKTGTAAADRGRWTQAWFIGYAPSKAPEVAVLVFLAKGRGGSDAAPVAGKILSAWAAGQARRK